MIFFMHARFMKWIASSYLPSPTRHDNLRVLLVLRCLFTFFLKSVMTASCTPHQSASKIYWGNKWKLLFFSPTMRWRKLFARWYLCPLSIVVIWATSICGYKGEVLVILLCSDAPLSVLCMIEVIENDHELICMNFLCSHVTWAILLKLQGLTMGFL